MSTRPLKVREEIRVRFLGLLKAVWKREYEVPRETFDEQAPPPPKKISRS